MKWVRRILLILVVVALVAAGVWFYQTRMSPSANAAANTGTFTQIVPVREGSLDSSLSVVGELDAEQSEDLAFTHVSGTDKLATLQVAAGNTVTKGQVLASIDPAPYKQVLDQAQSDLAAAEKTLADLKTPPTALAKSKADVAVSQAETDLEQAKQDLADLQAPDLASLQNDVQSAQDAITQQGYKIDLASRDSLAKSQRDLEYTIDWNQRRITELTNQKKKNLEEQQELTNRQTELNDLKAELAKVQAQRDLESSSLASEKAKDQAALVVAQEALAKAKVGGDELALAKAQLAIQTAQVNLAAAQQARADLDAGPDATALASAQADVDKKRLAVADAQAALDATQLTASFDGTVLKTNLKPGDQLTANTTVLSIANLHNLQVLASVDETTIRRIKQGQSATISFDAFPGQSFQGTVLQVPLQGELQGDVMVYQVPLSLSGAANLPLLVGMTANVNIQTDKVENGLLVPTMALQRQNGGYQVLVVDPTNPQGQPVAVPVEVGLSDGTYTQITQGLTPGDQVVVTLQNSTNQNGFFPGGGAVFFGGPGGGFPGGRGNNRNTRSSTGR